MRIITLASNRTDGAKLEDAGGLTAAKAKKRGHFNQMFGERIMNLFA